MVFFLELSLIIIVSSFMGARLPRAYAITTSINCTDTFLTSFNCTCTLSGIIESMNCSGNYLPNTTINTLPDLAGSAQSVQIRNTYTLFPVVPSSYSSLANFDLSYNKITSIGNLKNLSNLIGFYMSNNLINQLNSTSFCSLTKVTVIDLSYNLIDTVYMENFVCNSNTSVPSIPNVCLICKMLLYYGADNSVFTNLQVLLLQGNKIKQVYRLDLIFVGMPLLYYLDMSGNQLTSINVTSLSTNSLNVMSKSKQLIANLSSPNYFDDFIVGQTGMSYTLNFSSNLLTTVSFDFADIFTVFDGIIPLEDSFLLAKIAGISLFGNNITCTCEQFSDFNFLLYGAYNHTLLPSNFSTSPLASSNCLYKTTMITLNQFISSYSSLSRMCLTSSKNTASMKLNDYGYTLLQLAFLYLLIF